MLCEDVTYNKQDQHTGRHRDIQRARERESRVPCNSDKHSRGMPATERLLLIALSFVLVCATRSVVETIDILAYHVPGDTTISCTSSTSASSFIVSIASIIIIIIIII